MQTSKVLKHKPESTRILLKNLFKSIAYLLKFNPLARR